MSLLTLATEGGGGFELPSLEHMFEFPAFLFEDSALFAFNRTAMLYLLAAVIVSALMITAFRRPKIVPGRFQGTMEGLVEVVRKGIVLEVMGTKGLKFLPLLTSMFLFILVNNLFEVIPFINFPPTGRMALPAFLAIMVWALFIIVGIKAQGVAYFKNAVIPPDVPWPILILIIPIEIVSVFIVRPLTLSVRLFANLMAGHILLTVAFLATSYNLIDFHELTAPVLAPQGAFPFVLGILTFAGAVALVAFEIMVSFLQAYIFTILTAVYLDSSLEPAH